MAMMTKQKKPDVSRLRWTAHQPDFNFSSAYSDNSIMRSSS